MDLDASIKELKTFKADVIAVTGGEARFKSMVVAARQHGEQPVLDEPRDVPAEQLSEQTVSDLHLLALRLPDIERTLDQADSLAGRLTAVEEALADLQRSRDVAKQAIAEATEAEDKVLAPEAAKGAAEQTSAPAAS